jgi:DtxR family Mn-dependent transcriptional regulator
LLENTDFGKFLVEKLDFSWDEVHEIAEQLEHIKSEN